MSLEHIAMILLTLAYIVSAAAIHVCSFREGHTEGLWEGERKNFDRWLEVRKAKQQGWTFGDEHLDQPPIDYQKYAPGHPPCCNGYCS